MHVLMTLALFLLGVNLAYLRFGPEGFRTRIRREAEATGRKDQPPSVLNEYRRFAYWAMLDMNSKEYSGDLSEKEAEILRYNLVRSNLNRAIRYVAMPIFQNKPELSDEVKRAPKDGSRDPDHQLTIDQAYSWLMVFVGSGSVWTLSLMMAFNSTIESTGLLAALGRRSEYMSFWIHFHSALGRILR